MNLADLQRLYHQPLFDLISQSRAVHLQHWRSGPEVLSNFIPQPESVPINSLMAMPGTPLAGQPPIDIFDLVRLIAVTRVALPKARVRLAAGRTRLTREGQALCFFAGANSIFYGDKLLTAANPAADADAALPRELGLAVEPAEAAVAL